jgi:hypothetical protein
MFALPIIASPTLAAVVGFHNQHQLPAVLPRHVHRMLSLLRKARVVDDPEQSVARIHMRQHPVPSSLK